MSQKIAFWERLRDAALRRIHGPYRALSELDARIEDVQKRLVAVEERSDATHHLLSDELRPLLRALAADESENRRRLRELRARPDYELAWSERRPLVSVTVTTYNRPHLLASRSLPSILGQSYDELEVIVVGDNADSSTEAAVTELGDERVTFRNLSHRLLVSDDRERRWLVGGTMARNEATQLARGRWIVEFDDDDEMRADCVERLIERARQDHSEVVYGRALLRVEEGPLFEIGTFPPELGQFTWGAGMYHSGLRFLQRELFAADLGVPGDWFLADRMQRAGARFGMVDAVLCDLYPSKLRRDPG